MVLRACAPDALSLCGHFEPGDGRVIAFLAQNASRLGQQRWPRRANKPRRTREGIVDPSRLLDLDDARSTARRCTKTARRDLSNASVPASDLVMQAGFASRLLIPE